MNLPTLSRKLASSFIAVCTLSSLISCGSDDQAAAPTTPPPPAATTYTLGGTVSGLSGAGLVLANGSDTVSVGASTTTFTLPTSVATGAGYAITVKTQPAGQTCAVGNGSGTVQSANVINIAVTCTLNTFSLGGTVSGLSGSGLVLINGSDTVAVAAGAKTFTLPTAVDTGTSYVVAVQTQPSGQTCTVANGSGTMQSANVANVVVTCAVNAFSVGGTVSGLNGSGLVLANGSDAVSVSAGAAKFTLPAPVATGSSYTVTVKTQPVGEACAVSSGMGTMAAAAVTNVSVACTDQPFNLSGSIVGLTTSGLVLANGSDTATVAANAASFRMPTQVKYDSAYAVTVQTQPTGLTCSVSAGAGTMPASAVSTVVVSCSPQAYVLGGTVTGLTTGSAVLTDGTDTVTLNTGTTTFSLPTQIAFGSHYALSIQTQPAGLVCSLGGNSSGTMPATAVSVVMTCSPSTYMLGGTISGLTASGLVLANGSDTVPVAAGATLFSMNNSVAFGSTYRVTVTSSPVGEWCTLASGSGTATVDISSIVQITCQAITAGTLATWTVPPGITSIQVVATGGGGGGGGQNGGGTGAAGGNGAVATSTLSVQPGDQLSLYVGGAGQANSEGGGGGGLTYIGSPTDFVIAAGGGGGGSGGGAGAGGNGGASGSDSLTPTIGGGSGAGNVGGPGGAGLSGNDGGNGTPFTDITISGSGSGGAGNNPTGGAGGAGISGTIGNGGPGGFFFGAGGGGGGYGGGGAGGNGGFGGGGGGDTGGAGGGGGGSTGPTGTTYAIAPSGSAGAGGAGSGAGSGTDGNQGSAVIILNP